MKAISVVSKIFFALLAIVMFSGGVSTAIGVNPYILGGIVTGITAIPLSIPGVAYAGLNQEIWTDVLVEEFSKADKALFLDEIPDESRFVSATRGENEVIHLVDIGADPEVLINNTTYPIGFYEQVDGDIVISLDKFQTKATKVTDDEIQFIAYDKIRVVQSKHTKSVIKKKHRKAIHALAPASHTADTPVLITTGDDDGTGRKKLVPKDILALKRAFDALEIEDDGRILVLSTDHYNDLLEWDAEHDSSKFALAEAGVLKNMIEGFKVYTYVANPYFTVATKVKLAFGAIPDVGDQRATVAFYAPDMFKATGMSKNYTDEPDTQNQAWFYNIRHNFICLPRKQRAIAAIISGLV